MGCVYILLQSACVLICNHIYYIGVLILSGTPLTALCKKLISIVDHIHDLKLVDKHNVKSDVFNIEVSITLLLCNYWSAMLK